MRAREYLLEYNRQKTAQNFGDKIIMIARRDSTLNPQLKSLQNVGLLDAVLSMIEQSDPTKNKEYSQALAKLYSNGGIRFEDLGSTVADYLTKFHKLKVKRMIPGPRNDFMRYQNIADFYGVVDEYPDPNQDTKEVDKGRVIEYYNDADIRIVMPQDEAAACYYGQGTRWCTAAKNHNMFDTYADQGTLYIVIPKHPEHTGEKYQLHFESGQYMDEGDNPVTMRQLLERFPTLRTALAEEGRAHGVLSLMSDEDIAKVAVKGNAWINAHGVDQGNGIITVSLNQPNSDVEEFYLDSRVANIVNAATSKDDFDIPVGEPGEGNIYIAYAVVDTKNTGNTWIVWGEIDYDGRGKIGSGRYYTENNDYYSYPEDPTMKQCVGDLKQLIYAFIDTEGDYDMEDPFAEQRVILNTLKKKYGE